MAIMPIIPERNESMNWTDSQASGPVATKAAIEEDQIKENWRLHPRYTTQVQIDLQRQECGTPARFTTTDLSRGGCYIQLEPQFPLGLALQATLWLDSRAIVVRTL
jgi:hypothetical protein